MGAGSTTGVSNEGKSIQMCLDEARVGADWAEENGLGEIARGMRGLVTACDILLPTLNVLRVVEGRSVDQRRAPIIFGPPREAVYGEGDFPGIIRSIANTFARTGLEVHVSIERTSLSIQSEYMNRAYRFSLQYHSNAIETRLYQRDLSSGHGDESQLAADFIQRTLDQFENYLNGQR